MAIDVKALGRQLVDMKRPKQKAGKGDKAAQIGMPEQDAYPWGMRLNLEKEELKKLGIKTQGRKVGDKVMVVAEGEIVEISSRQTMNGEDRDRMELQLKKLKVV